MWTVYTILFCQNTAGKKLFLNFSVLWWEQKRGHMKWPCSWFKILVGVCKTLIMFFLGGVQFQIKYCTCELSHFIWTTLKLVHPWTYFSEIFRPTLKNLYGMPSWDKGKSVRISSCEGTKVELMHVSVRCFPPLQANGSLQWLKRRKYQQIQRGPRRTMKMKSLHYSIWLHICCIVQFIATSVPLSSY